MAAVKKTVEEVIEQVAEDSVNFDKLYLARREEERAKSQKRIQDAQQALNEHFPHEVERQLKKGGATLTYIPVSEVITRLNKVLGFDAWSSEIISCERDALDPDFIVAHVRLTIFPDGEKFVSVTKDGFGGQKIKRMKNGDIVDLGDEFKGAISDALKKAAQSLGVALYLARTEEAMEAEIEADTPAPPPAPPVNPAVAELWDNFVSLSKSLDENGRLALNKFWSEYSDGRAKPTKATADIEDLENLIGECIRISFDGSSK